jgi:hypothetical protein
MNNYKNIDKVPELGDIISFEKDTKKRLFEVDKVKNNGRVLHLKGFLSTDFASITSVVFICLGSVKSKIEDF